MGYYKKEKLHIVVALAVIRNPDGKFLVLKRSEREIVTPGYYTIPGGKVEGNDTIEETLQKECLEEANIELLPGKVFLCDHSFVRPDSQTVKTFSYLCEAKDWTKAKAGADFTDCRYVTIEELNELQHVNVVKESFERAEGLIAKGFDLKDLHSKSVK